MMRNGPYLSKTHVSAMTDESLGASRPRKARESLEPKCSFGESLYNEMWELYARGCNYSASKIFEALWEFFEMERFHQVIGSKYTVLVNYCGAGGRKHGDRRDYYGDIKFRRGELVGYLDSLPTHRKKEYVAILGLVKLFGSSPRGRKAGS